MEGRMYTPQQAAERVGTTVTEIEAAIAAKRLRSWRVLDRLVINEHDLYRWWRSLATDSEGKRTIREGD